VTGHLVVGSGIGRAVALAQAAQGRTVRVTGASPRGPARYRRADRRRDGGDRARPPVHAPRREHRGGSPGGGTGRRSRRAGRLHQARARTHDVDEAWTAALRLNLFSAVLLVEALTSRLVDGDGRVVLIGSTAGQRRGRCLRRGQGRAAQLRSEPRPVARRTGDHRQRRRARLRHRHRLLRSRRRSPGRGDPAPVGGRTLVGRLGTPDDVAGCVTWLLSPESGWTTGQVISPNGGVVLVR
jgi:3-oxoacyl-[acyl-carrier protein] reductase